jgi:phosphoglycolate phosphatase
MPAIIFDLDGTLIDSLGDITAAANHALTSLGQPTHTREAYRLMVGYGADVLFQKALAPDAQHLLPEALATFKQFYAQHPDDHTVLFPGVVEMLDALVQRSVPIAVLSNKPHGNTRLCVEQMLGRWQWSAVLGHRDGFAKKPAPDGALEIARQLGLAPHEVYFLGDAEPDVQTAVAAGMIPIGALWGYRDAELLKQCGARELIEKPQDLLDLIRL